MKNDGKISDDYFEFLLKKVMDDTADNEGDKYLEELESINEPEYSDEYKIKIDKILNRKKHINKIYFRVIKTAAVFVVGTVLVSTFAYNANANFRTFINKIFTDKGDHIDISYNKLEQNYDFSSIPEEWEYFYVPQYIPSGYEVEKIKANGFSIKISYQNKDSLIIFSQNNTVDLDMSIDTENTNVSDIKINGYDGYFLESEERNKVIWNNKNYSFGISGNISKDELIKIAESIELLQR